jgi:hypothetical protein
MLSAFEDFLVVYEDFPLINGKFGYSIPYRAVGSKLRDVALLDNNGNLYEMSKVNLEDVSEFQNSSNLLLNNNVFYIQDNKVMLPTNLTNIGSSIRMYYYLAPSQISSETNIGTITNINSTTGEITMSNFPVAFTSLTECDFVSNSSPNKILSFDVPLVTVSSTVKSVTIDVAKIPTDLAVGDYVCPKQETLVLQLPPEFAAVISQRVAVQALEALGDEQAKQSAERRLKEMETSILMLIQNRVEGANEKIGNRNGILRGAVSGIYRRDRRF